MSSPTQDRLYEMFLAIAGTITPERTNAAPMMDDGANAVSTMSLVSEAASEVFSRLTVKSSSPTVTEETAGTTNTQQRQTTEIAASKAAVNNLATGSEAALANPAGLITTLLGGIPLVGTTVQAAAGGGSAGSVIESIASDVFKSGLGMLPLIGGLIGLFGGGESSTPAPLVKYALPAPLAFQSAESPNGIGMGDYDQNGRPRAYQWNTGTAPLAGTPPDVTSLSSRADRAQTASSPSPQITVNVQAMDARSFLDRSSDIAAAVKEAMLNLNSINDVVNDL